MQSRPSVELQFPWLLCSGYGSAVPQSLPLLNLIPTKVLSRRNLIPLWFLKVMIKMGSDHKGGLPWRNSWGFKEGEGLAMTEHECGLVIWCSHLLGAQTAGRTSPDTAAWSCSYGKESQCKPVFLLICPVWVIFLWKTGDGLKQLVNLLKQNAK